MQNCGFVNQGKYFQTIPDLWHYPYNIIGFMQIILCLAKQDTINETFWTSSLDSLYSWVIEKKLIEVC